MYTDVIAYRDGTCFIIHVFLNIRKALSFSEFFRNNYFLFAVTHFLCIRLWKLLEPYLLFVTVVLVRMKMTYVCFIQYCICFKGSCWICLFNYVERYWLPRYFSQNCQINLQTCLNKYNIFPERKTAQWTNLHLLTPFLRSAQLLQACRMLQLFLKLENL